MWLEQVLGVPLNIIILCMLAGAARIFLASEPSTLKGVLGVLSSSLFLAVLAYPYLTEEEHRKGLVTLLVAVGSFAGKDIGLFMIKLAEQARSDPWSVLRDWFNFLQSRKKDKDQ